MSSLWTELEKKSSGSAPATPSWGQQTTSPTYRGTVPVSTSPSAPAVPPPRSTDPKLTLGGDTTDRPYAYRPRAEEGFVEEWRPPSFWQIMADMGLRALEAAIGAAFYEMAVFFTRRRFMPPGQQQNR